MIDNIIVGYFVPYHRERRRSMPTPTSATYLEISRSALAENAKAITDYVGVPVIGVVKCGGYGVSIPEAAAAWVSAGVTMLAVSEPSEAILLRDAGYTEQEILLLSPVADPELLTELLKRNIILTVSGEKNADFYLKYRGEHPVRVHIAVDSGMGRFGYRWTDLEGLTAVYRTEGLTCEGIFSHFAASFESGNANTKKQLDRFLSTVNALESQGISVGLRHIANSCAALRFPETRLDAVRVGSALVGRLPASVPLKLKKVGVFRATVVDRRTLKKGDTTGYASICAMKRDTEVAVVAIGHHYSFGVISRPEGLRFLDLLRSIKQAFTLARRPATVSYKGKALPVVGRIGSQYTLVAVGESDIQIGDTVTAEVGMMYPQLHHKFVD